MDSCFLGKVIKDNAYFENMGTDLLYRVAIPHIASYDLISPIFHLDNEGNKIFFKPDLNDKISMKLSKLNTGARSWVEARKNYSLYYYDTNEDWVLCQTQQSKKDSILLFDEIPSNTLYWLWDVEQKRRLERPFIYENGEQLIKEFRPD